MQYDRGVSEGGIAASGRATPGDRWRLVFRVAAGLAALVLAGLAVQDARSRARAAREIERLLADTGLARRQPDIAERIRRDPDAVRGRLGIARALLAESFDQKIFSRLPQREAIEEASRVGERLELARTLAEQAFPERPAAWQAPMIAGAATYRLWSMRGDPRLFSERAAWEGPLLAAAALAPGEDEPPRLLAWARLEIWPGLSAHERRASGPAIDRAFADEATFARLAGTWLDAADSRDEAFARVPSSPAAWSIVRGVFAGRRDWDGFIAAHSRWTAALKRELQEDLVELEARRSGGDDDGARVLAYGIVSRAPAEAGFVELVERAMALLPASAGSGAHAAACRRWLRWHVDLFVRGRPGLKAGTVGRLSRTAGELKASEAALIHLAAGELAAAEVLERRTDALTTEEWAPYCVAKARELLDRRELPEARAILARTNRNWRGTPAELEVRLAVAEAANDRVEADAARAELTSLAAVSWPETAWRWHGQVASLDAVCAGDSRGFEVSFERAPVVGAMVEVFLDGHSIGLGLARPGIPIALRTAITRGPHYLEVVPRTGGRVTPFGLTLLETPLSSSSPS
jgi:hypothetical protein